MIDNKQLECKAPNLEATTSGGGDEYSRRSNILVPHRRTSWDSDSGFAEGNLPARFVSRAGIGPMDRAEIFRIYDLGANIRPLLSIQDNITVGDFFLPMMNAQSALSQLLGPTPQAKIEVCRGEAQRLWEIIGQIEKTHFNDEKGNWRWPADSAKEVGAFVAMRVRSDAQAFETVFRAELELAATYWVPKRGSYNTRDLVDEFEKAFLPELHSSIGHVALAEYRSAGRCYAFGLWSAAGYHVCRAVESVLRKYFSAYTNKPDAGVRNWGGLIHQLNLLKTEPKPKTNTMFYLQQLKDNDRNPLMHVRIVLNEGDADILLNQAKVVIALMAREMIALEEEKKATPLLQQIAGGKT